MSEDGDFGVAMPQAVALELVPSNRSAKQLKALLGAGFPISKWKTPLNPKAVNVISIDALQRLIFIQASKGIPAAVTMWNSINPDAPFVSRKRATGKESQGIESKFEEFVINLYNEFNPIRQVQTIFGIADVVHEHGVVEIKEYRSLRSAHTAMGQAMSYGAILNKQPEVILFNVPKSEMSRVLQIFTAVGMLVLIYDRDDTNLALSGKKWYPSSDNSMDINLQIRKHV
jgi:hypothetical protein